MESSKFVEEYLEISRSPSTKIAVSFVVLCPSLASVIPFTRSVPRYLATNARVAAMKSFPGFFFNVAVLAGLVLPTLSAPGAVDSNNVGTYATPQYIVSLSAFV